VIGSGHRFDRMARKDLSTRFLDREKTKRGEQSQTEGEILPLTLLL